MGHSSIQVTVDIYGHLVPGSNKQAVDRLDEPVEKHQTEAESATIRNQDSGAAAEEGVLSGKAVDLSGAGEWD
jgi:hypothetical protein